MSRLARFAHALVSGYVLLGANVVYSLVSIPLALAYLSRAEFGLWCLVTQISGYLALVDVGMSGAVSRILIDYKDRPGDGNYGSVVQTTGLVGLVQGILVLLVGCAAGWISGPLLRVPADLQRQFMWLIIGQSLLQALGFASRVFALMLAAHQRYDVTNWSQSGLVLVNYGVLWGGFAAGFGVYSALAAQGVVCAGTMGVNFWWCIRLRLFPASGQWGRPTWQRFGEIFAFGKDVFLYSVGYQIISASQVILATRELGLEAAAIWTVCTRVYSLVYQMILRIADYGYPVLSEMFVRGESEQLSRRFRSIVIFSVSLAVIAGVLFGACNQPFVAVWTQGRVSWSISCDVLLAILLPLTVLVRVLIGIIGVIKEFRFLRYLYLWEGLLFCSLSLLAMHRFGLLAMIGASLLASLVISFPYALRRTSRFFRLPHWTSPLGWCQPGLRLALTLTPPALAIGWLTHGLPAVWALPLRAVLLGALAAFVLWHKGLETSLKTELKQRMPWKRLIPGAETSIAKQQ